MTAIAYFSPGLWVVDGSVAPGQWLFTALNETAEKSPLKNYSLVFFWFNRVDNVLQGMQPLG